MKQPLELHSGPNPDPFQGDLCIPDAHGRCVTCSDDAQPVRVLSLDQESWTAQVEMEGRSRDVDVSLVADVAVGDVLLVHGGVALQRLETDE